LSTVLLILPLVLALHNVRHVSPFSAINSCVHVFARGMSTLNLQLSKTRVRDFCTWFGYCGLNTCDFQSQTRKVGIKLLQNSSGRCNVISQGLRLERKAGNHETNLEK
jgi:hypothetical protein